MYRSAVGLYDHRWKSVSQTESQLLDKDNQTSWSVVQEGVDRWVIFKDGEKIYGTYFSRKDAEDMAGWLKRERVTRLPLPRPCAGCER